MRKQWRNEKTTKTKEVVYAIQDLNDFTELGKATPEEKAELGEVLKASVANFLVESCPTTLLQRGGPAAAAAKATAPAAAPAAAPKDEGKAPVTRLGHRKPAKKRV